MPKRRLLLNDDDLRELFALFSSPTLYEREQIYNPEEANFYMKEDLAREYALTQDRREFAIDAWRSVLFFLSRNQFSLTKDGIEYDLRGSSGYSAD